MTVVARICRGLGELLITVGVLCLLFVVYELWITDLFNARTQSHLHAALTQKWAQQTPAPADPTPAPDRTAPPSAAPTPTEVPMGDGMAILRIPRLGDDYDPVVVEGVSTADLKKGPGHYPGTAMPGQIGNFVVSGHRTTYGRPFERLDQLKDGDAIVVETADTWYTYRVTGEDVVKPTQMSVILPVPGQPGATPTQALLTFTTCNPKYSASTRLIVHGILDSSRPKAEGAPPALAETPA